jgi:hypothetical protein
MLGASCLACLWSFLFAVAIRPFGAGSCDTRHGLFDLHVHIYIYYIYMCIYIHSMPVHLTHVSKTNINSKLDRPLLL